MVQQSFVAKQSLWKSSSMNISNWTQRIFKRPIPISRMGITLLISLWANCKEVEHGCGCWQACVAVRRTEKCWGEGTNAWCLSSASDTPQLKWTWCLFICAVRLFAWKKTTLRQLGNLHKPVMMSAFSPVFREGLGKEDDVTGRGPVDSEQLTPTRRKSRPAGTGAYIASTRSCGSSRSEILKYLKSNNFLHTNLKSWNSLYTSTLCLNHH